MLKPNKLMYVLGILYPKIKFGLEIKDKKVKISVSDLDFYLSKEFEYFLNDLALGLTTDEYMNLDFYPLM